MTIAERIRLEIKRICRSPKTGETREINLARSVENLEGLAVRLERDDVFNSLNFPQLKPMKEAYETLISLSGGDEPDKDWSDEDKEAYDDALKTLKAL